MQVLPSMQLSTLVKHYLYVESNTYDIKKFRLFADGHSGMVFSFKNRLMLDSISLDSMNYLPYSFIYGQIGGFKNIYCINKTALLVVVFHPYGVHKLLGVPANELIDQILDLSELFGIAGSEITEILFDNPTLFKRIQIIESFLIKLLNGRERGLHPLVSSSLEIIKHNDGLITIKQLVDYTGYSNKSIERKFMETIGVLPKQFSKLVKLNLYLKALRDGEHKNKFDSAYKIGYYDHSHLLKDFKRNTGVTPGQYVRDFDALALNLLEYPK